MHHHRPLTWCSMRRSANHLSRQDKIRSKMADGRHFENRYIAIYQWKNHSILMKFCTQQQILKWMNVTSSKMKKLHWIDSEFDRTYFLFLLVVTSASDLPVIAIKFCSSASAYSSMPVINKIHRCVAVCNRTSTFHAINDSTVESWWHEDIGAKQSGACRPSPVRNYVAI